MFQCMNKECGKTVQPRQPINRIVVEDRRTTYQKPLRKRKGGKITGYETVQGWEIVKEVKVCPECYKNITGEEPKLFVPIKKVVSRKAKGFNAKPTRKKHRKHKTLSNNSVVVEKVNKFKAVRK